MNSAAKKILLAFGTVLLVGAVAVAQTDATSGTSSKAKKKHSTQTSASSTQNTSNSSSTSAAESSTPASGATASQSNSALPQSDSTASTSGAPATSSVNAGNSGFDDNNGSTQTQPSQASATSYGASSQNSATQTGSQTSSSSSDEISNGPVAETVSDSSALIGWSTRNAASNTGVKYGTNRASLSQTAQGTDGSDGKNHHVKLDGLSPNTRYYFQVTDNGQAVGGIGTFRTTAAGEQPVQSKAVIPQK